MVHGSWLITKYVYMMCEAVHVHALLVFSLAVCVLWIKDEDNNLFAVNCHPAASASGAVLVFLEVIHEVKSEWESNLFYYPYSVVESIKIVFFPNFRGTSIN